MLVNRCGRVPMTVYVVTLWMNACTCTCTSLASGLNRLMVLLLAIYMHALVLMLLQVAGTLAKALGRTVLSDRRPRDHSAGYPIGFGVLDPWVSWRLMWWWLM